MLYGTARSNLLEHACDACRRHKATMKSAFRLRAPTCRAVCSSACLTWKQHRSISRQYTRPWEPHRRTKHVYTRKGLHLEQLTIHKVPLHQSFGWHAWPEDVRWPGAETVRSVHLLRRAGRVESRARQPSLVHNLANCLFAIFLWCETSIWNRHRKDTELPDRIWLKDQPKVYPAFPQCASSGARVVHG